ncbi:Ig-like domain-containing protein [Anaerostipes hadrus]|uniref:Ig-like domain-containing protein n=1 Tax=Anaerostipes hadrus TaxID=649756 RepID=UPI001D014193|nr:Ig-like domain-containing protein [Anaerostipes hadrus]MCB5378568.1 Ig-like domain-containing protein [Anaerostipes hadrus]
MQKGWKVFSHLNGKSRKKLLACLLSISMIPVNGFTVMAATADQGNQAAVTQEGTTTPTVTSGISFAAESQNVTVGNFKYYEFQGTQAKDFDKVNFNISDQTALKIEQKTFKQADGTEVVKYMPIALKDSGKVTVIATFEKNKKPLDGVSAQLEFNLSKDDNIIPFTSQTMYQVFSGKEEGALTKADLAAKTEINLSDKGLTDAEVAYLQYATGCEKLDLSKNTNISKIDALKSMTNLKKINLEGTKVSTADRIALIKKDPITVEKGAKTNDPILPKGILKGCKDVKYSEEVAAGTTAKLKSIQVQSDGSISLEAVDTAEAGTTNLKVESTTTPTVSATIPVNVTAKSATTPEFDKNDPNVSVGAFKKQIKLNNLKKDDVVTITSKDTKILNIRTETAQDGTKTYYLEPKAAGKATVEAVVVRAGKTYTATIEIQVAAVGKDIIPLISYKVYDALEADADKDGKKEKADRNNDGMISTEEIKNVKLINLENKDLTNADLAGLSEAVNCKKIDLENNKNITDISFVKNLKQLKTLYLRGTSVTDFTALNDLKAQLESLYLPTTASTATRMSFLSDSLYLKEGQELTIQQLTKGVFVDSKEACTITSSNVAAVSITGDKIKAGTKGQMAILTLKAGTTTKTIKVYTTDETGKIPTQAVVLNKTFVTLNPGKTEQLKITYLPDYATASIGTVKWTSSNEAVVTVDAAGKLTAKAAGKAIITAITSDGNVMYCIVTVENIKVSKITITTTTSNKIATGKKVTLKATVTPSNAYNKGVTWKSSNTKVATVSSSGVVTTKKKMGGKTVTITATAKDGSGKKASYKIYVKKGIVKKVYISGVKSVKAGKKLYLKGKTSASSGANRTLKWSSSNTKYAKVSSKGTVTTYKAGKKKSVKITARAVDGSGKSKTVTIKIK